MALPDLPQAKPQTTNAAEESEAGESQGTEEARTVETVTEGDGTIEDIIDERIESRTAELDEELRRLQEQVEALDNFARISLNERKIKQSEVNLSEFSASMSGFAEKAFNNINELEERLNLQSLLLAALVESLDEEGVDLDLREVKRQQAETLVMEETPQERLESTIEQF